MVGSRKLYRYPVELTDKMKSGSDLMHRVLLLGAGKIGRMIAKFFADCGDYDVLVADHEQAALARIAQQSNIAVAKVNATKRDELQAAMTDRDSDGTNCGPAALGSS